MSYYGDMRLLASFGRVGLRIHAAQSQVADRAICGARLFTGNLHSREAYIPMVSPLREAAATRGGVGVAIKRVGLCGHCEHLVFSLSRRPEPNQAASQ
jgi:hypothetical protein